MICRNPLSGQTQEVAEFESVRQKILEQAGWVADSDMTLHLPADDQPTAPTAGITVKINDDLVVLPPGAQPVAAPGYKLVEVTSHDSAIPEFIEAPDDAPRRKRSK